MEDSKSLALHNSSFNPEHLNFPEKQEVFENKTYRFWAISHLLPLHLAFSSALSQLRELDEKNSNVSGDETDEEVTKDQQQHIARDDELGGIFNDGNGNIPFVCDPNRYNLQLQDRDLYSIFLNRDA